MVVGVVLRGYSAEQMDVDRDTIIQTGLAMSTVHGKTARSWSVRVVGAAAEERVLALGTNALVIGAHQRCDVVIEDPKVSSRHVELAVLGHGVRVKDLDSTNGTFWQSARIGEVVVPAGSSVEIGSTSLRFEVAQVVQIAPSGRRAFGGLVGQSVVMRELFAVLELASPTDATVLIQGESGTGKELAARAIHDHSARAAGSFVVVDCGSISEQLAESQLFGHVKGAFTGAIAARKGAFQEASGGTLFLDELGELPMSVQAKLLRALEQQEVVPVGSDQSVKVDTRVIAATHRDLLDMVERQCFRFDLFHRLAVVHVAIPPLREHPEDIPELLRHLYSGRGVHPENLSGPNLELLERHRWPGNVRELRNVLERALALSGGDGGDFGALKLWLQDGAGASHQLHALAQSHLLVRAGTAAGGGAQSAFGAGQLEARSAGGRAGRDRARGARRRNGHVAQRPAAQRGPRARGPRARRCCARATGRVSACAPAPAFAARQTGRSAAVAPGGARWARQRGDALGQLQAALRCAVALSAAAGLVRKMVGLDHRRHCRSRGDWRGGVRRHARASRDRVRHGSGQPLSGQGATAV